MRSRGARRHSMARASSIGRLHTHPDHERVKSSNLQHLEIDVSRPVRARFAISLSPASPNSVPVLMSICGQDPSPDVGRELQALAAREKLLAHIERRLHKCCPQMRSADSPGAGFPLFHRIAGSG